VIGQMDVVSAILRVLYEGQTPRPLQEKAMKKS
jgi:hypothetical protein